jgi:hypothetical protein
MTPDRFQEILSLIREKFEVVEEKKIALDDMPGTIETIVFISPMGRMKLDFIRRPVVLGKKAIGSKRIGSDTRVEYIYSDTEESFRMNCYQWNEATEAWNEIRGDIDITL